jgi:hypothetical protein
MADDTTATRILALADEIVFSIADQLVARQIADVVDAADADQWEAYPALAARLAYAAVALAWRDQADAGWFAGTRPCADGIDTTDTHNHTAPTVRRGA